MAKVTKSSRRWLDEHFADEFVQKAQREGYRGRAVYKLQELDQRYKLFRPSMTVVDLGAAPGSWSEYLSRACDGRINIVASDILPMDALPDVTFIQGDFQEDEVYQALLDALDGREVDLVMSDMAPNMTGNKGIDIPRAMYLVELCVDLAEQVLKPNGDLLMKVFQGEGYDQLLSRLRQQYQKVLTRKPKASRPRSKEIYVLARGKKP